MRKILFVVLAGLILLGTLVSLQSQGATPSYASGLGGETDTPTASASPSSSPTATASPTVTQTPTPPGPIRFPIISKDPTRTPTATPTTTATPSATRTSTVTATQPPITTGLTGALALKENKPTYATNIENVFFYENIFNPTGGTIFYGILGVDVQRPDGTWMPFKTSWDGAGAPSGRLQINAGCHGPSGGVCAPNADGGRAIDHVGTNPNEDSPWKLTQVGQYKLHLMVCYSSFSGCQSGGAVWAQLAGPLGFQTINWTPGPDEVTEPAPTPGYSADYGPICYLIKDDPAGMYLSCERPKPFHRSATRSF